MPDLTSSLAGPESCTDKFDSSKLYVFIVHSLLEERYYIWSWPFEINYLLLKEKQLLLQLHKYSCFLSGQKALPAAPYTLQEAAAAGSIASTSLCFSTSSTVCHKAHLEESPLHLSDVASILNLFLFCCRKIIEDWKCPIWVTQAFICLLLPPLLGKVTRPCWAAQPGVQSDEVVCSPRASDASYSMMGSFSESWPPLCPISLSC